MPLNGVDGGLNLSQVNPNNIGSVEVIKGAAFSIFGAWIFRNMLTPFSSSFRRMLTLFSNGFGFLADSLSHLLTRIILWLEPQNL
ncbi:hypothetical protein [Nitritalea halalkaliphila]|uniref:hypothetical protein n=1 Tax=Nitritalea halalkaliphila TaxID=590849 RepID=UPI00373FC67E